MTGPSAGAAAPIHDLEEAPVKLATLRSDNPDGRLVVVSRDLARCAPAPVPTLQAALEDWGGVAAPLQARADAVNAGTAPDLQPFVPAQALAPLPRAWQWLDGSAFLSHARLMARVFGMEESASHLPLMYQGMSHRFMAPLEEVPFRSEQDGIDFEGEFAVITDAVPMGTGPAPAARHIRLVALINDWSLRLIGAREMKTGFGWVQAKPACSAAPVVVTPDELGPAWARCRVRLPLRVNWNGAGFGQADGGEMSFGFDELIAYAAATRDLCAGTIVGSGTVSNEDCREVGSSCIAERRGIEMLDHGEARTGYLRSGDRVTMEVLDADGTSVFGRIDQRIVVTGGTAAPATEVAR
ncbi:fumarylacetoacetate hydrolase family protein [Roseomonas sp. NAR14]|uniref:Fumarylacetoacetate hydrolase family protein n=1 Tax=Roseomonas acroporae TaxID=2937791 RepID=A0A9X1YC07_9PROT|nr:fumarylacetoacetate hydrolase family protein [Roseomonas acroporae]MCK8787674.1 fumarylacetoacetate hydrolase family protein [Roseomonas acroporae]